MGRPPAVVASARVVVATLALCVAAAAPSSAAPPDTEARAHFDAGLRFFDEGDYARAIEEFETARRFKPLPDLLINIATAWERLYRPARAREAYEKFLDEAPPGSDLRALADRRLRVLRALPGSILVDGGRARAAVTLRPREGTPGEERTGQTPVAFAEVAPGAYHLRIEAPGFVPIDEDVTLAPGETLSIPERLVRERETVTVFSSPDGARVFLDDADTGAVTPFSRTLDVGAHRVRLELPDRPPRAETFVLVAGNPVLVRITLSPPPRSGRTEMLIASMAFGGFAASALTVAIGGSKVTTGTGIVALGLAAAGGVGAGLLGGWALTDDGMKVGHSSIIIGSTIWGGLAGTSLAFALGTTGDPTQHDTMALSLLGAGLGMGAGILTAWLANPPAGDSAVVNSGGLWGTSAGALLTEALSARRSAHDPLFGWLTLGGNVLGLTTGALFAYGFNITRSHAAIIDAAALLGTVIGYSIGYAAGNDNADPDSGTVCPGAVNRCVAGARYALGGMALGLVVAALITRRYHFEVPRTEALLERRRDGRWLVGMPHLSLGAALTPTGPDTRATVELLRGTW